MLTVVTDSTCDLSPEELRFSGVHTVPIPISHMGQEFYETDLTPQQMLERVKSSGQAAVTQTPPQETLLNVYSQARGGGNQVLHVTTSRLLTNTYAAAQKAAAQMSGVTVVDSGYASYALGMQALRAARWADQGLSAPEVARRLNELSQQMLFTFAVEKLDFLRINNRVGAAAAFVGNLLGVQPIIELRGGIMESAGRARGQGGALKELSKAALAFQREHAMPLEIAYVHTAGGDAGANRLADTLGYLHATSRGVHALGPGITANAGPAFGLVLLPAEN